VTDTLADALAAFSPALPLAVAYSGGADSTALLLACVQKWPGQVFALHVHHGLQTAADEFERHCRAFCELLDVPLFVKRVDARHASGQSPEDAARRARYQALAALAQQQDRLGAIKSIAIAQHADDQIETILLALSRGAGLPGLSAMPACWQRDGIAYHRPLLKVRSSDIRTWLAERKVEFIEDPSNAHEQLTRNKIRARLMPVLEASFPRFRDTFARAAVHAAQAQALLLEVAAQDLELVGLPPVIARLQSLTRARQGNVLRHWLQIVHQTTPSTAQLTELLDQIEACRTRGHRIHIKLGVGFAERRGALLHWYNPLVPQ
jgi:tRNA(Ile)-lysidine synthase